MMNKLYLYLGYFNDALYYSILWFFVGGMCTMSILTKELSFMNYLFIFLLYFICLFMQIKQVKYQKVIAIVMSVLLSYISFYAFEWYTLVAGSIYYGIGCYLFLAVCNKKVYLQDEIKIILFVLVYASIVCFFMTYSPLYYTISSSGLFFVMISVVYCIRTNVITEYEHNTTETIQKERNIIMVNVVSLLVSVLCFLVRNHIVDFLMLAVLAIVYGIYFCIKMMVTLLVSCTNIIFFFVNFIPSVHVEEAETESFFTTVDEYLIDYAHEYIPPDYTWLYIVGIVVGIFFGYLLIRKLYRHFSKNEDMGETYEEKEYIFDSSELLKNVQQKLHSLREYAQLSKIRKQYVQTVNKCIEEGFEWKTSFTPNEYLRSLDNKKVIDKYDFENLTKAYNEERYR